MYSLICAWTNSWANNRDAGVLRHHCTHYDITVMLTHCPLGKLALIWIQLSLNAFFLKSLWYHGMEKLSSFGITLLFAWICCWANTWVSYWFEAPYHCYVCGNCFGFPRENSQGPTLPVFSCKWWKLRLRRSINRWVSMWKCFLLACLSVRSLGALWWIIVWDLM